MASLISITLQRNIAGWLFILPAISTITLQSNLLWNYYIINIQPHVLSSWLKHPWSQNAASDRKIFRLYNITLLVSSWSSQTNVSLPFITSSSNTTLIVIRKVTSWLSCSSVSTIAVIQNNSKKKFARLWPKGFITFTLNFTGSWPLKFSWNTRRGWSLKPTGMNSRIGSGGFATIS